MKAKEFIKESLTDTMEAIAEKYSIEAEDYNLMANILKIGRDCKPFLNEVNDPYSLLRGVEGFDDFFIEKRIRLEGREPLGMNMDRMEIVNNYFNQKFGAPFRHSMLCTGDYNTAEGFGDVYAVFPIGKYEILWSPEIDDLNMAMWQYSEQTGDTVEKSDVLNLLEQSNYTTGNINAAIASNNEIMIRAKGYYGLMHNEFGYAIPDGAIETLIELGTTL